MSMSARRAIASRERAMKQRGQVQSKNDYKSQGGGSDEVSHDEISEAKHGHSRHTVSVPMMMKSSGDEIRSRRDSSPKVDRRSRSKHREKRNDRKTVGANYDSYFSHDQLEMTQLVRKPKRERSGSASRSESKKKRSKTPKHDSAYKPKTDRHRHEDDRDSHKGSSKKRSKS